MSVASHLKIRIEEYDSRIRTFIPGYDEMLDCAAGALTALGIERLRVVDLGTGTGALTQACARMRQDLQFTVVDADPQMLDTARARLSDHNIAATFVEANFLDVTLPECEVVVSSLALHHVKDFHEKEQLYRRLHHALVPNGLLILADCCPSADNDIARLEHEAWRVHLRRAYSDAEIDGLFASWSDEDRYFQLPTELGMLHRSGFEPDVLWRRGAFAVIAAKRPPV
jgi:SAM-dependent methyltransferase